MGASDQDQCSCQCHSDDHACLCSRECQCHNERHPLKEGRCRCPAGQTQSTGSDYRPWVLITIVLLSVVLMAVTAEFVSIPVTTYYHLEFLLTSNFRSQLVSTTDIILTMTDIQTE